MPACDLLIPSSLFDTEIRIIAENDTQAIVAITCDKHALASFVQRNSQFFADRSRPRAGARARQGEVSAARNGRR